MRIKPLEEVKVTFRNENDQGILEDMDNLPTCQLYIDGALDPAITVAVTNIATGTYRAVWTMGDYSENDIWELVVTGDYDGIQYSRIIKEGYIDTGTDQVVVVPDGGPVRFIRIQASQNTTPVVDWAVGNYDLDTRILRIIVGSGSSAENPSLVDTFYIFENNDIFRENNVARITIPLSISSSKRTYPFSLRDITTGNTELQTGLIEIY